MATLLHIQSSPHGDRSASITVATHFIATYQAANSGDRLETLDLWEVTLPEFDSEIISARYAILNGQEHTPAQTVAAAKIVAAKLDAEF